MLFPLPFGPTIKVNRLNGRVVFFNALKFWKRIDLIIYHPPHASSGVSLSSVASVCKFIRGAIPREILPEDGHYTTMAGFLMAQSGRLLKPGDTMKYDGASFKVERLDRRRIRWIRFTPLRLSLKWKMMFHHLLLMRFFIS